MRDQKTVKPLTGKQFVKIKTSGGLTGRELRLCATIDHLSGQLRALKEMVNRDKTRVVSFLETEKDKYVSLIESLPPDAAKRRQLMTVASQRYEQSEKTEKDWLAYFSARQVAHGKPAIDVEATWEAMRQETQTRWRGCVELPAEEGSAE